jgi:hypothetical protein
VKAELGAHHGALDQDVPGGVVEDLQVLVGLEDGGVQPGRPVVGHLVAVGVALQDGEPGEEEGPKRLS